MLWGLWEPCSRSECPFLLPHGKGQRGVLALRALPGPQGWGAVPHEEGAQLLCKVVCWRHSSLDFKTAACSFLGSEVAQWDRAAL